MANNEYYGMPTTPNDDYLAHYGVRGMKWGVRKAQSKYGVAADLALGRQYAKAQKKLAKLEKRAASGKKYAKRAAALGAGAAAAGGLAAVGTSGVGKAAKWAGKAGSSAFTGLGRVAAATGHAGAAGKLNSLAQRSNAIGVKGGNAIQKWGKATIDPNVSRGIANSLKTGGKGVANLVGINGANSLGGRINAAAVKGSNAIKKNGITNNTIARIGAGAVGAGLAGAAGYNAYRAATTKRAAKKAARFRAEMDKAFAGTRYANSPRTPQKPPKKKRRG